MKTELAMNPIPNDVEGGESETDENPGAQMMRYGIFKDKRTFEDLIVHKNDYIQRRMDEYIEGGSENSEDETWLYQTYHAYNEWLERRGQARSPGSIVIWDGEWEGHEMRRILDAPRRLRWYKRNSPYSNRIIQIESERERWKVRHPRPTNGPRALPMISDPKGELLGSEDDDPPTDEGYDSDDTFVSKSGDEDGGEDIDEDDDEDSCQDTESENNRFSRSSTDDGQSIDWEALETPQKRTETKAATPQTVPLDSDDEVLTKEKLGKIFKVRNNSSIPPKATSAHDKVSTTEATGLSSEEEEEVQATPRRRRHVIVLEEEEYPLPRQPVREQKAPKFGKTSGRRSEKSEEVWSTPGKQCRTNILEEETEEDVLPPTPRNRNRRNMVAAEQNTIYSIQDSEDVDDEDIQVSPRKVRRPITIPDYSDPDDSSVEQETTSRKNTNVAGLRRSPRNHKRSVV